MKRNIFLIVLAFPLLSICFSGCKEKEILCASWDCPCEKSPANITLDWDNYNEASAVHRYFSYRGNVQEHEGDTLMVTGWVYWGQPYVDPMLWYPTSFSQFYLTSNSLHYGFDSIVSVFFTWGIYDISQSVCDSVRQSFAYNYNSIAFKKIYVKGLCGDVRFPEPGFAHHAFELYPFEIDTIPHLL